VFDDIRAYLAQSGALRRGGAGSGAMRSAREPKLA
jgi:hypothetical protein